ncbi:hypothetical protein HZP84_12245 [Elizabethkingia anophelis]|nr:hypothetical protein [Elizabethkingia anophelis]MCT4077220.1 hypothetical protein [Elizabethkingia anophelis]MCT4080901.1 hypothetical protein [Elizabethkingia anophelis]MCT4091580.1 hypothetical protein [Elizabethkingia anophelis]
MSIKKLPNIDLVISSEYQLDEMILKFGRSKEKIERKYYSLENTPEGIQENNIIKDEFEKSPKYNFYFCNDDVEGYYSTLNYSVFEKSFDYNDWYYDFEYLITEQMLPELLSSIKSKIESFNADNQSIIFFESLLQNIFGSNFFLTECSQSQNYNEIQKRTCEAFLNLNEKLFEELNSKYRHVFPKLLTTYASVEKDDLQEQNINRHTKSDFEKSIFNSPEAQEWFFDTLKELNVHDGSRPFGAVISAIFRNDLCKEHIFTYNISQKDYIGYLNTIFGKNANSTKLSDHEKHIDKIEELIKLFLSSE